MANEGNRSVSVFPQFSVIIAPVFVDLDKGLQEDLFSVVRFHVLARLCADLFQHASRLANDDTLLRVSGQQ